MLDSVKKGSADALDEKPPPASTGSEQGGEDERPRAAAPPPPIILGKDMADQLGAPVGSLVTVTSPQGELTPFGIVPKYKRFKVAGIFSSGFYDYDNTWAFIRLSDAQRLFDLTDVVSVLEFKVDDIYKAPRDRARSWRPKPAKASCPPTGWSRTARSSAPCGWSES